MKIKKIIHKIRQLLWEHHEPKQVALGVAVGVFIGCSPFYGFHTVLALLVSFAIHRANRLAILAGTQVSLPFIAPFIYWAEYKIGKFLLFCDFLVPPASQDKLMEASHIELGLLSVLVGSVAVGFAGAWVSYFITRYAAARIKAKHGITHILGTTHGRPSKTSVYNKM